MVDHLLPWHIIAPLALTFGAVFVIFNYLRTPIWMFFWFIVLGLSLYYLPGHLKSLGPAVIAGFIYMVKPLRAVNS